MSVNDDIEYWGMRHSGLSVLDNDWGFSQFPAVLGHEVTGRVVAVGSAARGVSVGQRVVASSVLGTTRFEGNSIF